MKDDFFTASPEAALPELEDERAAFDASFSDAGALPDLIADREDDLDGSGFGGGDEIPPATAGDDGPEDAATSYGTFFVGGAEFGLPTCRLREVVPYPENVTGVPLSSSSVEGIFSLRGELIPIVDLAGMLGLEAKVEKELSRVAVIEDTNGSLGVVLDRTGEVFRPDPESVHRMDHDDPSGHAVIDGVIQRNEEGRFIQTLSPRLLGLTSGAPQAGGTGSTETRSTAVQRTWSKAIVVRIGTTELAFGIEDVLEIQGELDVNDSPEYFYHCSGVVLLRQQSLPIMDLRRALGSETASETPSHYVFVRHNGVSVGLAVDALVETLEFPDDSVLPVPGLLTSTMTSICSKVLAPEPSRNLLMVEVERLFRHFQVGDDRAALGAFDPDEDESGEPTDLEDVEHGFFAFRVGNLVLCVTLENVIEVQELGAGVISVEEGSNSGLLNLRGSVVPLIQARSFLGITSEDPEPSDIALIVEWGDTRFGLVVDSVEDIKRVHSSALSNCSQALAGQSMGGVARYMKSALLADAHAGKEAEVLLVLDIEAIASSNEASF